MICVFSCTTCPRLCGHHSVCASPAGVTAVPRPATPLHNSQTQTFQFAFPKGAANCDMSSSSQHRCRLQHTTSSHQEASGIISLLLRAGCAGRASGPAPHYRATGSTAAPATSGYPAQGGGGGGITIWSSRGKALWGLVQAGTYLAQNSAHASLPPSETGTGQPPSRRIQP